MINHFVTFLSPGTLFSEERITRIKSWNVDKAIEQARTIVERHESTPYAFFFTTRSRGMDDLDSKEIERSGLYFLGGSVFTLAQIKARKGDDRILIRNMKRNGWSSVVENCNSWKVTQALRDGDKVLDFVV